MNGDKGLQNLMVTSTIFIGLVLVSLSYFETGTTALIYQIVSLFLLSFSIVLLIIINQKPRIQHDLITTKTVTKQTQVKSQVKDEEMFKKNIISIDLDTSELNEDEKKIMNALSKKGQIEQKEVTDKIFKGDKVKATRTVSSLEKKDLLVKKKHGKANRLYLID